MPPGLPQPSSAAGAAAAAESTKSAAPGRDDVDGVGLDAAVCLPRSGHGDRLAFLQVGGLADDGLAHDHALVEGDLDVGIAARVMDGQAVAGEVGDGAGGATPGCRTGGAGCRGRPRAGAGCGNTAPAES